MKQHNSKRTMRDFLLTTTALILSLAGACYCELTLPSKAEIKAVSSSQAPPTNPLTKLYSKPLESTVPYTTTSSTTKKSSKITIAPTATESPVTPSHSSPKKYTSTKGVLKSARRQKLNSRSRALETTAHSKTRLQERLAALDCDLPVLPRESRLWRGNETHELNLPVTECAGSGGGGGGATQGAVEEECPPVIVSWEGSADIQSGDILIVRIADSLLLNTFIQIDAKNSTLKPNVSHVDGDRVHRMMLQPAVYQVTRQGHEHCDVSDGMLLDITPLDEHGAKIFTLYEKDLTEGVNLLIVVSENWKSQCVRLKVTVKADNCGESQDCSGKGVCYTNVSMEGYECQCCPDYVGPHCEERDACNPSPCLNNGICVDLTQPLNGAYYRCLCSYGEHMGSYHLNTLRESPGGPLTLTITLRPPWGSIDTQWYSWTPSTYSLCSRKCERDPCYSSPCMNGGSCMSMASTNGSTTFHCECADGFTGAHCELTVTGGACASNPCIKGICIEQIDSDETGEEYRCFCQPGYTGDRCDMEYNECESSPCAHGGTCTDRVGGFVCSCDRGYTGNTCQLKVDLCSPNPCPAQRFCRDHGNTHTCECPQGYVGEECHLPARSPCDNNPCAHGGTCWTVIESFSCSCRPGFTGKLCEEDFILEPVVESEGSMDMESRGRGRSDNLGGGSVREVRMPLGLYHDRLHNVYIAAGTLGAAIAIVGVVVTACHCRVNKTYSRLLSRLSRVTEPGPPHHWLQDKRAPPLAAPFPPPSAALDTTDMYYTLDFSDSQSSPLIQ